MKWLFRLFSWRKASTVVDRNYIQYLYDNITTPWVRIKFENVEDKKLSKERAKRCATCRYSSFAGKGVRFVFNGRIISAKKVICNRNESDLTNNIPIKTTKCPIDIW